jgi:threonine dehydratase
VIAGQGTIGMELLRQHPDPLAAIYVPVGGGGLIAGIAAYVKRLRPEVRIIGVEPEDAASLYRSLQRGRRIALRQVGSFADGVAVRCVGREPFRIARRCVDEMLLVSNDEICAAIRDVFEDTRAIAEPAGALAVAGLKRHVAMQGIRDAAVVAVVSGANINFDRLRHVAERTELGAQREALLAVTIPERPGSFLAFCEALGERRITEFNYRFDQPAQAHVFAGIHLGGDSEEKPRVLAALEAAGYPVLDLSDNELAKIHVRHMVGGHAHGVTNEVLYRFEFPEHPGALLRFLAKLGRRWNISLFHYRNHGDAYGRVLIGMQVPAEQRAALHALLDDLGYPRWEETANAAYRLFAGDG